MYSSFKTTFFLPFDKTNTPKKTLLSCARWKKHVTLQSFIMQVKIDMKSLRVFFVVFVIIFCVFDSQKVTDASFIYSNSCAKSSYLLYESQNHNHSNGFLEQKTQNGSANVEFAIQENRINIGQNDYSYVSNLQNHAIKSFTCTEKEYLLSAKTSLSNAKKLSELKVLII